jgi:hypothetical protein
MVNRYPDWSFDVNLSYERLKNSSAYQTSKVSVLITGSCTLSCGILLEYVGETSDPSSFPISEYTSVTMKPYISS